MDRNSRGGNNGDEKPGFGKPPIFGPAAACAQGLGTRRETRCMRGERWGVLGQAIWDVNISTGQHGSRNTNPRMCVNALPRKKRSGIDLHIILCPWLLYPNPRYKCQLGPIQGTCRCAPRISSHLPLHPPAHIAGQVGLSQ